MVRLEGHEALSCPEEDSRGFAASRSACSVEYSLGMIFCLLLWMLRSSSGLHAPRQPALGSFNES